MNNNPMYKVKILFKDGSFYYINEVRESNGVIKIFLGETAKIFEKLGTATVYGQIKKNTNKDIVSDFIVELV